MASYEKMEEEILKLFDEANSDDDYDYGVIESSCSDSEDSTPWSSDDDDEDPDYVISHSEASSDDEGNRERNPVSTEKEGEGSSTARQEDSWVQNTRPIPNFNFQQEHVGVNLEINEESTPRCIFDKLFNGEIVEKLVNSTNEYGIELCTSNLPNTRNRRLAIFRETNGE